MRCSMSSGTTSTSSSSTGMRSKISSTGALAPALKPSVSTSAPRLLRHGRRRFFRYTRYELPMRYNLNFKFLDDEGLGPDGLQPAVLHFADPDDKLQLFHAAPGSRAWRYLCYQPSLQQGAQT